jgi:hypothetical protein
MNIHAHAHTNTYTQELGIALHRPFPDFPNYLVDPGSPGDQGAAGAATSSKKSSSPDSAHMCGPWNCVASWLGNTTLRTQPPGTVPALASSRKPAEASSSTRVIWCGDFVCVCVCVCVCALLGKEPRGYASALHMESFNHASHSQNE